MEPIVSEIEGVRPDAAERALAVPVANLRQDGERGASKAGAGKPAARRRARVAEGIYKDRHGLAATVKVNGVHREVRFPPGTASGALALMRRRKPFVFDGTQVTVEEAKRLWAEEKAREKQSR